MSAADEAILSVVETMVVAGLPPCARSQVGLPFSEGGRSVRLARDIRAPARIAAIAGYERSGKLEVGVPALARDVVPGDFPHVVRTLQDCLGGQFDPLLTWARDWSAVATCPRDQARQGWWSAEWASATRRRLQSQAHGRDAARLAAQQGGLGGAWMQVVHMDAGPSVISPDEYRLGLRWLLGLPILNPETATCPACGLVVDIHRDHLLCCRRNNYYGRHFAVQESFAAMAQAGGQPYVREAPLTRANTGTSSTGSLRPADLLFRAWQGGVDSAVDVTVVHPLQAREMP